MQEKHEDRSSFFRTSMAMNLNETTKSNFFSTKLVTKLEEKDNVIIFLKRKKTRIWKQKMFKNI